MLKTVKGKVIAGTVAVTLFAGAGAAFGASDAGAKLQTWFNKQFNLATSGVEADANSYYDGLESGLLQDYGVLKTGATTKINDTKDDARDDADENIDDALLEHITSINTKKASLEGYMNVEFANLLVNAEEFIYNEGTKLANRASADMESHTTQVGTTALGTLKDELATSTNNAAEQLRLAIANAKGSLQDDLDAHASDTTAEIKKLIDTRIGEVRGHVTRMTDFMVQEQEDLIVAKALELENAAKASLQGIVDGI